MIPSRFMEGNSVSEKIRIQKIGVLKRKDKLNVGLNLFSKTFLFKLKPFRSNYIEKLH